MSNYTVKADAKLFENRNLSLPRTIPSVDVNSEAKRLQEQLGNGRKVVVHDESKEVSILEYVRG